MSKSVFSFRYFSIDQSQCAMRVGTDSVLLGSWAGGSRKFSKVLDVGAGTGLLSLLIAQRMPSAKITALEIDKEAAIQAENNKNSSPWGNRIQVLTGDFCRYEFPHRFDFILSNPPYFQDSLLCPDLKRSTARHTLSLSYRNLLLRSSNLLSEKGILSLILPADSAAEVRSLAFDCQLYTFRLAEIKTKYNGETKRVMMEFSRQLQPCCTEEITIHNPEGGYSETFRNLTKNIYPENHLYRVPGK